MTDGSYVAIGPRWKGVTHRLGPTAVLGVGPLAIGRTPSRAEIGWANALAGGLMLFSIVLLFLLYRSNPQGLWRSR